MVDTIQDSWKCMHGPFQSPSHQSPHSHASFTAWISHFPKKTPQEIWHCLMCVLYYNNYRESNNTIDINPCYCVPSPRFIRMKRSSLAAEGALACHEMWTEHGLRSDLWLWIFNWFIHFGRLARHLSMLSCCINHLKFWPCTLSVYILFFV